jgi:hypothetical protein
MGLEAESIARSIIDPDGAEGVDAFLHKRTPIIRCARAGLSLAVGNVFDGWCRSLGASC